MSSIYIHIPFCKTICSYCDFCKFLYNRDWVDKYFNELEHEVKTKYNNSIVKTIYIGGGTPSLLSINELKRLFNIIEVFKMTDDCEFTFECNIESINYEKLNYLFNNGVNRLSIGVQTFNPKYLELLNRHHIKEDVFKKIELAKQIGFNNINVDLMYALPNQTLKDVESDIDNILKLGITHVSTYSLMIEPHTKLYIDKLENISEELDFKMYELICKKLAKEGFIHYEVSNFAKINHESKHNLVYWNNLEYYGFGVGASGYIDGIRYDNTRNITKYLTGKWLDNSNNLSLNEKIENELILGLRKIKGINLREFYEKYKLNILDLDIIKKLCEEHKIIIANNYLYINPSFIYVQNEILLNFMGLDYESEINYH